MQRDGSAASQRRNPSRSKRPSPFVSTQRPQWRLRVSERNFRNGLHAASPFYSQHQLRSSTKQSCSRCRCNCRFRRLLCFNERRILAAIEKWLSLQLFDERVRVKPVSHVLQNTENATVNASKHSNFTASSLVIFHSLKNFQMIYPHMVSLEDGFGLQHKITLCNCRSSAELSNYRHLLFRPSNSLRRTRSSSPSSSSSSFISRSGAAGFGRFISSGGNRVAVASSS